MSAGCLIRRYRLNRMCTFRFDCRIDKSLSPRTVHTKVPLYSPPVRVHFSCQLRARCCSSLLYTPSFSFPLSLHEQQDFLPTPTHSLLLLTCLHTVNRHDCALPTHALKHQINIYLTSSSVVHERFSSLGFYLTLTQMHMLVVYICNVL